MTIKMVHKNDLLFLPHSKGMVDLWRSSRSGSKVDLHVKNDRIMIIEIEGFQLSLASCRPEGLNFQNIINTADIECVKASWVHGGSWPGNHIEEAFNSRWFVLDPLTGGRVLFDGLDSSKKYNKDTKSENE